MSNRSMSNCDAVTQANSIWLYIVPSGMRSLLNYVKDRYNSPPVYITENGKNTYKTWTIAATILLDDFILISYG
jgi:beta-glucosidase